MDGIGEAIGAGFTITLDGKKLMLGMPTLEDYGFINNEVKLRKRKAHVDLVAQMYSYVSEGVMPIEEWRRLMNDARAEANQITSVTDEEMDEWVQTVEGMPYLFWLMINRKNPGLYTYETLLASIGKSENAGVLAELQEGLAATSGATENPTNPAALAGAEK